MVNNNFSPKWLSIVGIGEEGLDGLGMRARSLINHSELLVGGERHLAMLAEGDLREKLVWASPIEASIQEIVQRRGHSVCVLASGDPMCYGIGVTLTRHIPITEITIVPSPSAFSLACARLGWSLTDVKTLSLCGRDPALLNAVLHPGGRLLVLSADQKTPAIAAHLLTQAGFGNSQMTVLEHMGSPHERIIETVASGWSATDIAPLNTIAITCIPSTPRSHHPASRLPGLPDIAYHHDGQLTKQEIRAITVTALAPSPGHLLWDVGAGCGSIGIEWMRSDATCRAIAIESHPARLQYIADNATALGTPNLEIVAGAAPAALKNLPQPNAIFIGGGLTTPDLLETCWQALLPGGRLVANVVTVEGEEQVFRWQRELGGDLTRIAIQRAAPVGKFLGWKAIAPVTQWRVMKT
ncbi:precorrin-6y C5,15-methyltransferase (decarboxylating) subunit CbiE [Myxacorys almedinensis]|uniref:Precorrin-6y C5,15-methyltransferase (Decarboxylating) subunit CbiE n=1 Tax=Myxacorys almedinensis A TaxID=2690445 RepID=A0A8J7Z8R7_9CYAN|nr:precorrin-6y C5,15-methyltransferase (decarboxylating) subunit CbiE [Myxacorys almedinensis]NDJ17520.1 precorrin-6y C5,15-methyltransferase (decarboxylating) subunit CbiE [Myxacorys almedinensis A]